LVVEKQRGNRPDTFSESNDTKAKMERILVDVDELTQKIGDPNWIPMDCRFALDRPELGAELYAQSHIPKSRYAHLDKDLSGAVTPSTGRHPLPRPEDFLSRLEQWGISEDTHVVAYDQNGGPFAARLWWLLRWIGHRHAYVLDGGFDAWVKNGETTTSELPSILPATRERPAKPSKEMWVTTDELKSELARGDARLVDARDNRRFRGEVEPIDPVAGHVPSAVNIPFLGNFKEAGGLLNAAQLHDRFAKVVGAGDPLAVIHICGSGVTACHNILAMEVAGLRGSRLYAGSWSEWIRNPDNPVALGE
jgi:thiosulfate/3-mercaptopyruvate sulfurtransferase